MPLARSSPSAAAGSHRTPVAGPGVAPAAFRGWRILAICTLARGFTAPGQTIGVSAFIDPMIDGLDISRSTISVAYLVGTLTGAVALPAIGRWVDRVGIRRAMTVVATAFAVVVMATSTVTNIAMLIAAFVGLRMLGQGSLSLIAATGVSVWFERRRGLALAISSTMGIAILSLAPLTFGAAIDAFGWRTAWVVIGAGVGAVLIPLAAFGLVDRPADIGQRPDGDSADDRADRVTASSMTVREAMGTAAFWTLGSLSALMGMIITGLTFHNTDILGAQGLTEAQAGAIFIPQMVGSIAFGFGFGALSDRVGGRLLLVAAGALLALGIFSATLVSAGPMASLYGLLTGLAIGSVQALVGALYPKWYGVDHIGAIKGVALSIGVGASALGPLLLSVGNDVTGSYESVIVASAAVTAAVAVIAAIVPTPSRS